MVTGASLGGQQPGQSVTPRPDAVFRSGVELILVDVVVRDRRGAIVSGLTAERAQLSAT